MTTYTANREARPPYSEAVYMLPTSLAMRSVGTVLVSNSTALLSIEAFSTSLSPMVESRVLPLYGQETTESHTTRIALRGTSTGTPTHPHTHT